MSLIIFCAKILSEDPYLTAIVPTVLWGAVKKYGALRGRVAYRLREQKRSRCFVRTLLIKDFKYGSSLSILVGKKRGPTVASKPIFCHDNNTTAEFDSGPKSVIVRGNIGRKCRIERVL